MARPKRDDSEFEAEMKRLAIQFSRFREEHNLSQKLLGEVIKVSRRTIQSIEAATIIPHAETLKKFQELKEKYDLEKKFKKASKAS